MAQHLQSLRQESARAIHGLPGERTYNGDLRALFESEASIPAGTSFNGSFLIWLNARLGASYGNLVDAQNAFAESIGMASWDEVGSFAVIAGVTWDAGVAWDGGANWS